MSDQPTAVVPAEGRATVLRFDGYVHVLCWGPDESGLDCFASRGRTVLRWDSAGDLERDARECGWALNPINEFDADSDDIDAEPAQRWLRGATNAVDPVSALELWNTATDVAYSLREPIRDGGRLADRCYDKLFAANLPWAFERESYVPRWTPSELGVLRRVLGEAVRVLRAGLPQP